jgi:dUTP pyrophosphatase
MTALTVEIHRLPHAEDLPLPAHATEGSAGVDLLTALAEPARLAPGERLLVSTGIAIALPPGYEGQIRPRSGLALEHGISVLNAPGTIDSDYRGEIKVILINLGAKPFDLARGMRIAQLVVAPVARLAWAPVDELPVSARSARGFGSTGAA